MTALHGVILACMKLGRAERWGFWLCPAKAPQISRLISITSHFHLHVASILSQQGTPTMPTSLSKLRRNNNETTCYFAFLKRSLLYNDVKPYYFSGALERDQEPSRSNLEYEIHDGIEVADLRGCEHELSLNQHGFQLFQHEPAVNLAAPSDEEVTCYLEDMANHVKERLGAEVTLAYSFRVCLENSSC
jgi:hypothetical protein